MNTLKKKTILNETHVQQVSNWLLTQVFGKNLKSLWIFFSELQRKFDRKSLFCKFSNSSVIFVVFCQVFPRNLLRKTNIKNDLLYNVICQQKTSIYFEDPCLSSTRNHVKINKRKNTNRCKINKFFVPLRI